MNEKVIAVCGLDCSACPIHLASLGDVDAAQLLVGWWKDEGWLKEDEGVDEVLTRGPHCLGCKGDRSAHWDNDCWILNCCVDNKGLEYCFECEIFPCKRLGEWAEGNKQYTEALNRLQQLGSRP